MVVRANDMKQVVVGHFVGALAISLVARPVSADTARVTIKGGPDASGHNYTWQVTNNDRSARIVYIQFPEYRADLFGTPDSWSQEIENVAHIGWKDRPGTCTAQPAPPYKGLPPGGTAEFTMRIARGGALVGKNDVTVRFDDGTEVLVADVTLPVKPERPSAYMALIGTGAIFVLFIVWNERRRRKRPADASVLEGNEVEV